MSFVLLLQHSILDFRTESAPTPIVSVYPANTSVALTGQFTIVMVDADIVGSDPSTGVNHHWLVNGVEITGCSAVFSCYFCSYLTGNSLTNTSATTITAYAGPGPAAGSGPHRYAAILDLPEVGHQPYLCSIVM